MNRLSPIRHLYEAQFSHDANVKELIIYSKRLTRLFKNKHLHGRSVSGEPAAQRRFRNLKTDDWMSPVGRTQPTDEPGGLKTPTRVVLLCLTKLVKAAQNQPTLHRRSRVSLWFHNSSGAELQLFIV
ncbi:hypothetical protein F2P81_015501 [Scophthalmus maximus]|uniref:Uncharacterized protein n=1 Tax=Scophthalmus maximus TaxID=52904 RepID=A0A6A4SQ81_SCOMX|nr:hypothetical protein F2P81_015501 [Scophthalmus maximus]